jgi:hypothetical protein
VPVSSIWKSTPRFAFTLPSTIVMTPTWTYRNCPAAENAAVPMKLKFWLPPTPGVSVDRIDVDPVAPGNPRALEVGDHVPRASAIARFGGAGEDERVIPRVARERVSATNGVRPAVERVIAERPDEGVVAAETKQRVVAVVARDDVRHAVPGAVEIGHPG